MSKLRKFFDWFAEAMIRGVHARAGVFLPKKLTIENVFDELWPDSSLEAREELIWMTPYPFVDSETVIESLKAMRER